MRTYDYAEVTRVACKAIHQGRSAALAIAAEYGIEESNARHVIAKARRRGYEIPYSRATGSGNAVMTVTRVEGMLFDPMAWKSDAACQDYDPDMWFPSPGESAKEAKRICAACNVREECLQYALDNSIKHGIWGGVSEKDRRPMRLARVRSMRDAEMGAA